MVRPENCRYLIKIHMLSLVNSSYIMMQRLVQHQVVADVFDELRALIATSAAATDNGSDWAVALDVGWAGLEQLAAGVPSDCLAGSLDENCVDAAGDVGLVVVVMHFPILI